MIKMGKRRRGFLTEWQRKFLRDQIKLEPSEKVSVEQRRLIEKNEIRKSVFQALEDFKLVKKTGLMAIKKRGKGLVRTMIIKEKRLIPDMDIERAINVLTPFKSWGRQKDGYLNIPLECPKCGYRWTKHYVKKEKMLSEGTTFQ